MIDVESLKDDVLRMTVVIRMLELIQDGIEPAGDEDLSRAKKIGVKVASQFAAKLSE